MQPTRKPRKKDHNIDKLLVELNRPDRYPWLAPWRFPLMVSFIALLLFIPCRTRWVYLIDSAEFALAIQNYNVGLSQPHAPGYFLYVMLGRLMNTVIGDPHTALVWLSVLCGAAFAGMLTKLATDMFDNNRAVGLSVGFLAATSPLIWFFSSVALTYVVDAFLATTFVWWCWRAMRRGGSWLDAAGLGLLLAVMAGVRQQSLPALLPLALFTASRFLGARWIKFGVMAAVAAAGTFVWVNAMLQMTGGWEVYRAAADRVVAYHAHKTLAGGGLEALKWNIFFGALYSLNGLMAGVIVLSVMLVARVTRRRRSVMNPTRQDPDHAWPDDVKRMLGWWILPPMFLGMFVGYTEAHGHVFGYLPGLIVITGASLGRIRDNFWRYTLVSTCCAVNLFAFFGWPASWDKAFFGTMRTDRELRSHDDTIRKLVNAVRTGFTPEKTRLLYMHGDLFLGLRHLQWHLPAYTHIQLMVDRAIVPADKTQYLASVDGHTRLLDSLPSESDASSDQITLLVVPRDLDPMEFEKFVNLHRANPVPGTSDMLWMIGGRAFRQDSDSR